MLRWPPRTRAARATASAAPSRRCVQLSSAAFLALSLHEHACAIAYLASMLAAATADCMHCAAQVTAATHASAQYDLVAATSFAYPQVGDNSVSITELPVRTWTQPYKEFLEGLLKGAAATTAAAGRKKAGEGEAAGPGAALAYVTCALPGNGVELCWLADMLGPVVDIYHCMAEALESLRCCYTCAFITCR